MLDLLAADRRSLSSVSAERAWNVHVEDSLSGLGFVGEPTRLADVGAGAGFPGLALAAALPRAEVDLIESVGRKCAFIEDAIAAARLENARAVCARAEEWAAQRPPGGGREAYDVVTSQAIGRLAAVAELAVPLLRPAGTLVVWKGRRDPDEEAGSIEPRARWRSPSSGWIGSSPGAGNRHLHLLRKVRADPDRAAAPPGMAKKRGAARRARGDRRPSG